MTLLARTLIFAGLLTLAACGQESQGPAEKAGEKIDEAVEDVRADTKQIADDAGDKLRDLGDEAGDAAEDMGDEIEDAADKVEDAVDDASQ